jgi:hypothetical protein
LNNDQPLFGIENFNKATNVFLNTRSEFYNHLKIINKKNNTSFVKEYTLYEGVVGSGNLPIFIKTKNKINLGDNKLFLTHLDEKTLLITLNDLDKFNIMQLCKKLGVHKVQGEGNTKTELEKNQLISKLLKLNSRFFELTYPINKDEISSKIGNPLKAIHHLLTVNTYQIDERLVYTYSSNAVEFDAERINCKDCMPHSDHKIIITNGGVGKSTLVNLTTGEPGFENSSIAGLIGFATADKKVEGRLANRTKASCLEELQEEKGSELFTKLHTLMEQGEITIARGLTLDIKSWSSLTFQGNPKIPKTDDNLQDYLMTKEFLDFLSKISENTEPFSRRIAFIHFDKNTKTLKGKGMKDFDKTVQIIRTISEGWKKEFTDLFFNEKVTDWLNKDYSDDYKELIKNIMSNTSERSINEFFKGQLKSHRHCKGMALKLSWLDVGLETYWKTGKVDIKTLLLTANNHLLKIQNLNIKSFNNIIGSLSSGVFDKLCRYNLENLSPTYLKYALFTLFFHVKGQIVEADKIIPLSLIKQHYDDVKDKENISFGNKYNSYSRVVQQFNNFKIKDSVLNEFGLKYVSSDQSFVIFDPVSLTRYVSIYFQEAEYNEYNEYSNHPKSDNNIKNEEKKSSTMSTIGTKLYPMYPVPCVSSKKNPGDGLERLENIEEVVE